jgi:hypothetical protein
MTDLPTVIYEPLVGHLDTGQQVLVQIFRDPTTGQITDAQLAFRSASWDTWGIPIVLKVAP